MGSNGLRLAVVLDTTCCCSQGLESRAGPAQGDEGESERVSGGGETAEAARGVEGEWALLEGGSQWSLREIRGRLRRVREGTGSRGRLGVQGEETSGGAKGGSIPNVKGGGRRGQRWENVAGAKGGQARVTGESLQ